MAQNVDRRFGNRQVIKPGPAGTDHRSVDGVGRPVLFHGSYGRNFQLFEIEMAVFALFSDCDFGGGFIAGISHRRRAGNNPAAAGNSFGIQNILGFGLNR